MVDPVEERIAENLAEVRGRIAQAAERSGRAADAVELVAVTKYVGVETIEPLVAAGGTVLGESRPQQFWPKAEALTGRGIRWHMIGHLQRNKIRRTLPLVELVHSAESLRMIEAVDRVAGELGLRTPILLEVNVSGDEAKQGFGPGELPGLLPQLAGFDNVRIRGLMCMAGLRTGAEGARVDFAALREVRDRLRSDCPLGIGLDELSMGMSGDYEVAIEEGATLVRVGSALYEGIDR
jgi:PLP dependent protein